MDQSILSEFSDSLHKEKYRQIGEDHRSSQVRMAAGLKDNDEHFEALKDIFCNIRFMGAGRTQAQVGTTKMVTAMNCAVSGTIHDSYTSGDGSIMARAHEAATTMRMGCGIGYDFSTIRPRGSWIGGINAQASGPVSFMHIYDAICKCTASSGNRRGAQMGVLRIDHPDIEEFIAAKQVPGALTGFNVSVGVTDEFMRALIDGHPFDLRWRGDRVRRVDPAILWEQLMRSTWDHAEPGVLFIDTINRMNNLWYCEEIVATNPCGEQPLPPHGMCLLGSFNLTQYIDLRGYPAFDIDKLLADVPHVVRAMDNIIERTPYPLPEHEAEMKAKRRMGLGVTGLANTVEYAGYPYGSPEFCETADMILTKLRDAIYDASIDLAKEKGAFPAYQEEYLQSQYIKTLPRRIRERIKKWGIRNSHLTSIAPTGTISLCANNVSSGIEPVFAKSMNRKIQKFDEEITVTLEDYGWAHLTGYDEHCKLAENCTIDDHLAVLKVAVGFADSAVSKTCVVPHTMKWDDFKDVYVKAWKMGAKGITTYTDGGKRAGIMERAPEDVAGEPPIACAYDPDTGTKSCE